MCGFCGDDPDDVAWNPYANVDDVLDRADDARKRAKEDA